MTHRSPRRPARTIAARLRRLLRLVIHPFRGSAPGASMVEYMVVLGFVSLFAILAFNRFGRTLNLAYQAEARHIRGEGIPGAYNILDDLGGLTDPDDLCDISDPSGSRCRPCSGTCFGPGTLVATEKGNRPIEEIEPGELVWSTNEKTGEKVLRPVLTTFENQNAEVLDLELHRGAELAERLEVTPAHRFWVTNRGWLRADQLAESPLWSEADPVVATASRVKGQKTVYNLEVEEFHTYHVGESGVLVHNQNSTPCPRYPDGGAPGPEPDDGVLDCGEAGAYNELPSSSTQQRDHVPSAGSLRKRTEMLLFDAPLTSQQEQALKAASPAFRRLLRRVENEGLTIAIPNDVHREHSQTYGGRNTYTRQVRDANDLAAAARANIAAVQAGLAGTDCADDYAAAAEEILNMTQADYDRRLQNAIDALTPEEREEIAEAYDSIT